MPLGCSGHSRVCSRVWSSCLQTQATKLVVKGGGPGVESCPSVRAKVRRSVQQTLLGHMFLADLSVRLLCARCSLFVHRMLVLQASAFTCLFARNTALRSRFAASRNSVHGRSTKANDIRMSIRTVPSALFTQSDSKLVALVLNYKLPTQVGRLLQKGIARLRCCERDNTCINNPLVPLAVSQRTFVSVLTVVPTSCTMLRQAFLRTYLP